MNITEELQKRLLKSIELSGSTDDESVEIRPLINVNLDNVIDKSSGRSRLRAAEKFRLIISQPAEISSLSSLEIRCLNCKRVISYPAWYWKVEYVVNTFHYFICFDGKDLNCKRR